jgi:hypothetical protein
LAITKLRVLLHLVIARAFVFGLPRQEGRDFEIIIGYPGDRWRIVHAIRGRRSSVRRQSGGRQSG